MTDNTFPMRLQVYMAKCGVASRRGSEDLISQGRVMVNNKTVREMGIKVGPEDIVQVDGDTIELVNRTYYIALNRWCRKIQADICNNPARTLTYNSIDVDAIARKHS